MDNTAQNNNTGDQKAQTLDQVLPNSSVSSVSQTQQVKPDDKILTGQVQFSSTPSANKERVGGTAFSEVIKPSEEEIKVEHELKEVGVSANSDKPKLDEVHEQIGVKHSQENAPVPSAPSTTIVLPMSEDEINQTLKTKQTKFNLHENVGEFAGEYTEDSKPFLATLLNKIIKEMHKKLFGKKA